MTERPVIEQEAVCVLDPSIDNIMQNKETYRNFLVAAVFLWTFINCLFCQGLSYGERNFYF